MTGKMNGSIRLASNQMLVDLTANDEFNASALKSPSIGKTGSHMTRYQERSNIMGIMESADKDREEIDLKLQDADTNNVVMSNLNSDGPSPLARHDSRN